MSAFALQHYLAVGAIMDNMGVGVLSILLTAGTLIAALPLLKMTDAAADTASVTPHAQATPFARTTTEKPTSPAE